MKTFPGVALYAAVARALTVSHAATATTAPASPYATRAAA